MDTLYLILIILLYIVIVRYAELIEGKKQKEKTN